MTITKSQYRDNIRAFASAHLDFTTGEHLSGYGSRAPSALLSGVSYDSAGLPILHRGTTNYAPNTQVFASTTGFVGAGGALGPGWEQGNTVVPLTVLSASTTSITVQLGPFPSFQTTTIRTRTSSPLDPSVVGAARGGVAFSATVSVDSASSASTVVSVGHNELTPSNVFLSGRSQLGPGQSARLVVQKPTASLGTGFVSYVAVQGSTNAVAVVTISQPQIESAASVREATDYTVGTRSASSAALLGLPDGDYKVWLQGTSESLWVRATSAAGSLPLDVSGNGSVHAQRILAFPAATIVSQISEALHPPAYKDFVSTAPTTLAPVDPSFVRVPYEFAMNRIENGYSSAAALNRPTRFRFEVRPGDNLPADAANGNTNERSEVYNLNDRAPWHTDLWVSYAFRFVSPPIATDPTNDFRIIQQWRYSPNAGESTSLSPDVAVVLRDDLTLQFITRTGPVSQTTTPATDNNPLSTATPATVIRWTKTNLTVGAWHFMVYRVRFSETDGFLEAYLDGTQMFNAAAAIGYTRDVGPDFRMGIYRHAHATETTIVEHANLEISTSSLSARVTKPLYP